jgi:hypothetical protein
VFELDLRRRTTGCKLDCVRRDFLPNVIATRCGLAPRVALAGAAQKFCIGVRD